MASPAPALPPAGGLDPKLVEQVKKQMFSKPIVATSPDEFGQDDDTGKPFMPKASMEVINGQVHIILPKDLPYVLTRDTSSKNRRLMVFQLDDPNGVEYHLTHNGKEIPVRLAPSSTINIGAYAIKV